MEAKLFEIRDSGTFIAVLAVRLGSDVEAERYLASRSGFGKYREQQEGYVMVAKIAGGRGQATCDPYDWCSARTMPNAHQYIIQHWDELEPGAVIDVEFILGETSAPKQSEQRLDYAT